MATDIEQLLQQIDKTLIDDRKKRQALYEEEKTRREQFEKELEMRNEQFDKTLEKLKNDITDKLKVSGGAKRKTKKATSKTARK